MCEKLEALHRNVQSFRCQGASAYRSEMGQGVTVVVSRVTAVWDKRRPFTVDSPTAMDVAPRMSPQKTLLFPMVTAPGTYQKIFSARAPPARLTFVLSL
jgi:hypothetical protein